MMKVVNFFLSMIIIWVDKYHFRCNLAIGNGIKKVYYNFGRLLQFRLSVLNRNCNNRNCNKKVITISVGYYNFGCHTAQGQALTQGEPGRRKNDSVLSPPPACKQNLFESGELVLTWTSALLLRF